MSIYIPPTWLVNSVTRQQYPITQESTLIGRARTNTIIIDDATVSADHASIIYRDGSFMLFDRGAKVTIQVNSIPINGSTQLMNGDIITFGQTTLQFVTT